MMIYEHIYNTILGQLEKGTVPWRKPWRGGELPKNAVTGRQYRGINSFLLNVWSTVQGYDSSQWATFKQINTLGGSVRKGEKSTRIVYFNFREVQDKNEPDETKTVPFAKLYCVFNTDQTTLPAPPKVKEMEFDPIEECEAVVARFPNPPKLTHNESRAFYRPGTDTVSVPRPQLFNSTENYYSTLFHELIHATGHPSRLKRFEPGQSGLFGSETYSKEELIAEFGSAFLCGEAGIETVTLEDSASYIDGWLKSIRSKDKRTLFLAAAAAQKASDYVLQRAPTEQSIRVAA